MGAVLIRITTVPSKLQKDPPVSVIFPTPSAHNQSHPLNTRLRLWWCCLALNSHWFTAAPGIKSKCSWQSLHLALVCFPYSACLPSPGDTEALPPGVSLSECFFYLECRAFCPSLTLCWKAPIDPLLSELCLRGPPTPPLCLLLYLSHQLASSVLAVFCS